MNLLWIFFFLSIASVSMFTFLSVAVWSDARRKEREAFYKNETLKKITEMQQTGATSALEFLREEERIQDKRLREGQRLGGLVTFAVGLGTMIFLQVLVRNEAVYLAGIIPLFIGIALLLYSYWLGPKSQ